VRTPFLAVLRCEAVVYRRLALKRRQCLRRHAKGSRLCWQHARAEGEKP